MQLCSIQQPQLPQPHAWLGKMQKYWLSGGGVSGPGDSSLLAQQLRGDACSHPGAATGIDGASSADLGGFRVVHQWSWISCWLGFWKCMESVFCLAVGSRVGMGDRQG